MKETRRLTWYFRGLRLWSRLWGMWIQQMDVMPDEDTTWSLTGEEIDAWN